MDDQGLNDAAIMLMSLGEEEAAEVFKHFSPKEVQKLGETIARMRSVSREKVDEVINKFCAARWATTRRACSSTASCRAATCRASRASSGWTHCRWLNCCATNIPRSAQPSWCTWTATRRRAS